MEARFLAIALSLFTLVAPLVAHAQAYRYEPEVVTLRGRLVLASGRTPDGDRLRYPALRLAKPIAVAGKGDEAPAEKGVRQLHLVLDAKTMAVFKAHKGHSVRVTGSLFHADNGHHQTPVLLAARRIETSAAR